jgi:hypothetical protein
MSDNYIFTTEIVKGKTNIKRSYDGAIAYITDRKEAEKLCLSEFGWDLPKSHNLIRFDGIDLVIA